MNAIQTLQVQLSQKPEVILAKHLFCSKNEAMKTKLCLFLLLVSCNLFAQNTVSSIAMVDFVKVLNGHEAETAYFLEQNLEQIPYRSLEKRPCQRLPNTQTQSWEQS